MEHKSSPRIGLTLIRQSHDIFAIALVISRKIIYNLQTLIGLSCYRGHFQQNVQALQCIGLLLFRF
jgi:hypothetical protein